MAGPAPKRRCRNAWVSTATHAAPGRSSAAVSARPSIAPWPSTSKKGPEAEATRSRSGSPAPATVAEKLS
jgi:hypothetical protein